MAGAKSNSRFEVTTRRPVAIIMIVLGIAVFGFVSYQKLSWDLMPEISYPSFTIRTEYPGAAPEEVENVVSRPLEEQLSLIKNLVSITSVSRPEQSDIILEFTWDVNLDRSAQEIREKIDQVYLDREVERPMILRFDPSLDPVLRFGIIGDMPLIELRQLVEEEIARELEALPGVAAARVKGGFEREILIKLDENKIAQTQVRFSEITTRLRQENVNLAGGNIKEGETEYIVRTLNEFSSVAEIGDIIVTQRQQVPIRLKDLAEITYSHKERKVITRVNRRESVEVNIYKEADANIVEVCNRVKDRLLGNASQREFAASMTDTGSQRSYDQAQETKQMTNFLSFRLPESLEYHVLSDQSVFIQNSINEVRNTAVIGGILAVIVLFLFLQNFSTTMIVAVSIPVSIVATFAPLGLFNVSLNIMSLGGLALGIGMLVDNSIVVMESIFRCREEGDGFVESAVRGVSEVGGAVIASTLTTIAVFFPIVFVEGIAGQIFGDLSLAVVFSLLASLMVSLFFIPMLASRKKKAKEMQQIRRFSLSFERERTIKNYLLVPIEALLNGIKVIGYLLVYFCLSFLSFLLVFAYPLPALFKQGQRLSRFVLDLSVRFSPEKLLWDEFMVLLPLQLFTSSIRESRRFYTRPFSFLYLLFRFFLQTVTHLFIRLVLTFAGLGLILFKALGLFLLTIGVPLVKTGVFLFNRFMAFISSGYPRLLSLALKNDWKVIFTVLVLFAATILLVLPQIGSELIPEVHQGSIYVNVTLPVGTPVEKSDRILQNITEDISRLPLVENLSFFAGTTKDELSEDEVGEHIGKITVNIKKAGSIQLAEEEVIASIRQILGRLTDLDYNISRPVLFTVKPPIEIVLRGYNLNELRRVSRELFEKISLISGLKDVQSSVKAGFPELVVEFDRSKLSHYSMNAFDVASLIKNKIEGFVATKYKERDRRIDVRVFLKDEQRQRAENIKNLIINPGGSVPIHLTSVADVNILSGPNEIRRVDQDRSAIITANISDINLKQAVQQIYDLIEAYPIPAEISYELSGQNKEMETSLRSLMLALFLAIFLVYIVMASQFESFLHPFLILFTIPMALIGVFVTLYVLNIPLGVTVYIGLITLVGIVVNNAIVLIDYINILRKRGLEKIEAITQAGKVRLRPILITTTTTVLGLLPMALGMGEGTEIRTPMAVSIIAGLISATFLTLVLIPLVYNRFSR